MGIPRVYRQSSDPAVASYDFTDIVQGQGKLYLYAFDDSDGNTTLVTDTTLRSSLGVYSVDSATPVTYTVTIGKPFIIKGNMIWSQPIQVTLNATDTVHFSVFVFKVAANGTETKIGEQYVNRNKNWSTNEPYVLNATMNIANNIQFAIGDQIKVIASGAIVESNPTYFFRDPANRTTINAGVYTAETTQAKLILPVKIDL